MMFPLFTMKKLSCNILSWFICFAFWVHLFSLCRHGAYESIVRYCCGMGHWNGPQIILPQYSASTLNQQQNVCTCVLLRLLCVYWSFPWCPGMLIIFFLYVSTLGINRRTHMPACVCVSICMGVSEG